MPRLPIPNPQQTARQFGKVAMKKRKEKERDALRKQIERDKAAMRYQPKKTFDKAENKTYTMEQWAGEKPVRKLGESKKDFGTRHRNWLGRRPKI